MKNIKWYCHNSECPRFDRAQSPYNENKFTSDGCLTCGARLHLTPSELMEPAQVDLSTSSADE